MRALLNSVLVTGVAVTAPSSSASVASFALAKSRLPGHRLLFALIVAFLLVPGQVLLIPIYLLFSRLELVNNYLSVILIYTALALPFGTLPDVELPPIPTELIESARIDGASLFHAFRSIILPIGSPDHDAGGAGFLTMWNELLLGMLLPDESKRLLTPDGAPPRPPPHQPAAPDGGAAQSLGSDDPDADLLLALSDSRDYAGIRQVAGKSGTHKEREWNRQWRSIFHRKGSTSPCRRKGVCARRASVCQDARPGATRLAYPVFAVHIDGQVIDGTAAI